MCREPPRADPGFCGLRKLSMLKPGLGGHVALLLCLVRRPLSGTMGPWASRMDVGVGLRTPAPEYLRLLS